MKISSALRFLSHASLGNRLKYYRQEGYILMEYSLVRTNNDRLFIALAMAAVSCALGYSSRCSFSADLAKGAVKYYSDLG